MNAQKEATPAKLNSGDWGALVRGIAKAGETVTIRTKTGKVWDAQVTRVLWTGDGVSLCATVSLDSKPKVNNRKVCACGTRIQSWHDGAHVGQCHDCYGE